MTRYRLRGTDRQFFVDAGLDPEHPIVREVNTDVVQGIPRFIFDAAFDEIPPEPGKRRLTLPMSTIEELIGVPDDIHLERMFITDEVCTEPCLAIVFKSDLWDEIPPGSEIPRLMWETPNPDSVHVHWIRRP